MFRLLLIVRVAALLPGFSLHGERFGEVGHGGYMFYAAYGRMQAEDTLGLINPLVAVGSLLGMLSVGKDRLEGTGEVRVPVFVAGLGADELVDWTHVRSAGR